MVALENYLPSISVKCKDWVLRKIKTIAISNIGINDLKGFLDEYELLIKSTGKLDQKYNARYISSVKK